MPFANSESSLMVSKNIDYAVDRRFKQLYFENNLPTFQDKCTHMHNNSLHQLNVEQFLLILKFAQPRLCICLIL